VRTSTGITEVAAEDPGYQLEFYSNSGVTKGWPTSQIAERPQRPEDLTESVTQR
jgi:hypothetical protein